jgi:hypothetical protein
VALSSVKDVLGVTTAATSSDFGKKTVAIVGECVAFAMSFEEMRRFVLINTIKYNLLFRRKDIGS